MTDSALLLENEYLHRDMAEKLQDGLPSQHHTPFMKKLCIPLKENFKINYIKYARYYDDGVAIASSDDEYTLFKLLHSKNNITLDNSTASSKTEWVDYDHPELTHELQEKFSYLNGLSVKMKHETFIEHLSLGTSYANTKIIKQLQQNQELLNSIIFYFREAATEIIDDAKNYKIPLPDALKLQQEKAITASLPAHVGTKKFIMIGFNGDTTLTYMEKTCLIEALKLKTSKQIACGLNISPKTVEHHLAKLKVKLGIKNKNELYIIAQNNALI